MEKPARREAPAPFAEAQSGLRESILTEDREVSIRVRDRHLSSAVPISQRRVQSTRM
jgi:hypothetical protein